MSFLYFPPRTKNVDKRGCSSRVFLHFKHHCSNATHDEDDDDDDDDDDGGNDYDEDDDDDLMALRMVMKVFVFGYSE